ncbi:hypothetical protein OKW30_001820 [Paraburkholderia sp. Clong3]|nr:hypothetical protein [Paraburkholderia sp. CI2]
MDTFEWVGLRYSPLPYESTPSIIGRFAYFNVLSRSSLTKLVDFKSDSGLRPYPRGIYVDKQKFIAQTGWEFPGEESRFFAATRELSGLLFSNSFRFCPSCLDCGYHSYWHQFEGLERCPLHGEVLTRFCPNCKRLVGTVAFGIGNGSGFYNCPHCSAPLSGSPFSSESHEYLRDHTSSLDAFRPLQQWWAGDDDLQTKDVMRIVSRKVIFKWAHWCDDRAILRGMARRLTACALESMGGESLKRITVLRWPLQLTTNKSSDDERIGHLQCSPERESTAYRTTLRALHNWAVGKRGGAILARDIRTLMLRGVVSTEGRDLRQLALAWFRLRFELWPATPFGWVNPDQARWGAHSRLRHMEKFEPRPPLSAFLLATYSLMLEIVKRRERESEVLDVGSIRIVDSCVPVVYLPDYRLSLNTSEPSEGFVIFPSLSGFDLDSVWLKRDDAA